MIPGIMAAQMRVASGDGTLWTPLNMATVPQIYLDAQDSTVTDVSGFASAISNLGGMGSDGNFSQGTAGNRPAILSAELNGKRVLSFDGTNDALRGGSVAQKNLFRNVGAAWVFYVVKKRLIDASPTSRYMLFSVSGASTDRFISAAGSTATGNANTPRFFARRTDGGATGILAAGSVVQGYYSLQLHAVDFVSREGVIYLDGLSAVSNPTLIDTSGNTTDTASAADIFLGTSNAGSGPADIDLAAVVISNTAPSAADIDKLFGWAAHKYGLTANLPGGHPYKTTAPTV